MDKLKANIKILQSDKNQNEKEILLKLEDDKLQYEKMVSQLNVTIEELHKDRKEMDQEKVEFAALMNTKVINMEAKEVEMISQIAQLKEDVNSYQIKFETSKEEASKLLQSMQDQQEKFKEFEDEISQMKAQLDAKQTEIEEKAEHIKQYEGDHATTHKELES